MYVFESFFYENKYLQAINILWLKNIHYDILLGISKKKKIGKYFWY